MLNNTLKRIAYAVTNAEKQVFFFTGILMPLLALRFQAEARTIQAELDAQHTTVTVTIPDIITD